MVSSSKRFTTSLLLLTSLIPQATAATNQPSRLVRHVTTLIETLAPQRTETFDCWFYHASSGENPALSDLLAGILATLPSNSFPRLVLNSLFQWPPMEENELEGHRLPSLLVIHFEYNRRDRTLWAGFGKLLAVVPSHTRVLVLVDMGVGKGIAFRSLVPLFYTAKMLNVVYLGTTGGTLYFDFYRRRTVRVNRYLGAGELFVDLVRDLNGYEIQFATASRSMSNMCVEPGLCGGYDVSLLAEMAIFMNASIVNLYGFACPESLKDKGLFYCVRDEAFRLDCIYDIFIEPVISGQYSSFYLDAPVPVDDAFLVPLGRQLNIVEFFWKPFQYELWIILLVGMLVLKVVSLLFPSGFRNDILLLPICGFERFNLNRAARREKFVLLALIVLFFFISNAYETKIVSLMTDRPRIRTVDSIRDFPRGAGMKIKADRDRAAKLPALKHLFIFRNYSTDPTEDKLDGVSAYLTNSLMARILLQRFYNWDFEANRPRYKLLDETLGMMVAFYPVPRRSTMRGKFRFVQRALFEAGVLEIWRRLSLRDLRGDVLQGRVVLGDVNPMAEILKFSDLLPAWFVELVGCAGGLVVLVVELLVRGFTR